MDYISRQTETLDWITLLLLSCVIIYAVSNYFFPRRFQEFVRLPITNTYFLVQGKNNEVQHPFNILLFATQIISVTLFIYLLVKTGREGKASENEWLFVQICTAYTAFVLVKFFIEKIVGVVFSIERILDQYLYQKLTYRNLISILIFIGNLLFFYVLRPSQQVLLIFLGVVLVFNGFTLFYSYKTNGNLILRNFFYFILYLCALEISPYLILYKVFLD